MIPEKARPLALLLLRSSVAKEMPKMREGGNDLIEEQLRHQEFLGEDYRVDANRFREFQEKLLFPKDYPVSGESNRAGEPLEHYNADDLLPYLFDHDCGWSTAYHWGGRPC